MVNARNHFSILFFTLSFSFAFCQTAETHFINGQNKHLNKDFQGALTAFNSSIQLKPQFAMSYYYRSLSRIELGNNIGAIEDLDKAIALDKNVADFFYFRANIKFNLKNYTSAILDYTKAIQLEENYKDAYFKRANAFQILKLPQKACKDYFKAAELGEETALKLYSENCK